jgi:hypothetical protein
VLVLVSPSGLLVQVVVVDPVVVVRRSWWVAPA